jgi:hypothetical protein
MSGKIITVDFRSDTLFAVERDDGVFVAVKPICDALGLVWRKQQERLRRDPVLSEGITMTVIPSPGGAQETTCLRLDLVNGWLFTIDESRVPDEDTRQKVIAYKRECYAVLFQHFYGKRHPAEQEVSADDAESSEGIKLRMVNEGRQVFGVRAAAELWFKLNLPVVPSMFHDPRQLELIDYSRIKPAENAA